MSSLRNELQNKEKNYENQLASMKTDFDKKEELYQEKITKLSAYNPEGQRNKIQNEIEVKYKQILVQKEHELEEQQNLNTDLKRKYELLLAVNSHINKSLSCVHTTNILSSIPNLTSVIVLSPNISYFSISFSQFNLINTSPVEHPIAVTNPLSFIHTESIDVIVFHIFL